VISEKREYVSLRYALLAVLTVEPMTGYDLSKQFQQSVSHVWNAPDSQIYPELRRMEAEGLLTGSEVPWGPRGTKREYSISQFGLESFKEWMKEPVIYTLERDLAHLKAAYLEWSDVAGAQRILTAHLTYYHERLEDWSLKLVEIRTKTNALIQKRMATFPSADHERIIAYKAYTYEGLIARAEAEILWANRGLVLVEELERKPNTELIVSR
jgi:DNA-binding PadR family transcriptional regulator